MDINKKIERILLTTKSTYSEYKKQATNCNQYDLENLNAVFEDLTVQELINKYIIPTIEKEDETFNYIYEKGLDDKKINTKENTNLKGAEYEGVACYNWVQRKRKELKEVKSNPIEKGRFYETLKTEFSSIQKVRLLEFLKDNFIVDSSTKNEIFNLIFTEKGVEQKPKIKFLKKRQLFAFLLLKLKLNKITNYSDIIQESELFVIKKKSKGNTYVPFNRIKDVVSMLKNNKKTLLIN